MNARDPVRAPRQKSRCEGTERRDHPGPDERHLAEEMWLAGDDLRLVRVAILWRTALEDVRDVDGLARKADSGQQLLEERTPLRGEPVATLILPVSGCLADEHQIGVGIAVAEDDPSPRPGERAALTSGGLVGVRRERLGSREGIHHVGQSRSLGG